MLTRWYIGHIAWHVEAGMLMQFLVGAEVVGGWSVPRAIEEGCSHPELQRGLPLEDKDYYL